MPTSKQAMLLDFPEDRPGAIIGDITDIMTPVRGRILERVRAQKFSNQTQCFWLISRSKEQEDKLREW